MRIKVTEPILDYENKPIEKMTFRSVFSHALNNMEQGEQIPTDKKSKLYELTLTIFKSKEPNITVDQAALIKERVAVFFNPLVYGRVCDLLEGNTRASVSSESATDA